MDNTKVTSYHLISQAGWNSCNLSIYLSARLAVTDVTHRVIVIYDIKPDHGSYLCDCGLGTGSQALLNITSGWEGAPRSQRPCPWCQSQYSAERQAVLECSTLTHVWEKCRQRFRAHDSMRQYMWQSDMFQSGTICH